MGGLYPRVLVLLNSLYITCWSWGMKMFLELALMSQWLSCKDFMKYIDRYLINNINYEAVGKNNADDKPTCTQR